MSVVTVIGAVMAGCEAAWAVAQAGIPVTLYEMKPQKYSPAHHSPGMAELVRELKGSGYGIYLLSNASIRQHEYWPRIPASRFFDGTLISADHHVIKPQPEIYRLCLERFGLKAEECIFVDDMAHNVEGAVFCGVCGSKLQ